MKIAHRHSIIFFTLMSMWFGTGVSHAGDVLLYREGVTPDPNDIAKILGAPPQHSTATRPKTRGLKLLSDTPPAVVEAVHSPAESEPVDSASAVALQVQFPFNSAEIQADMEPALDAVAEGIRMASGVTRVMVEGHTDAVGTAEYNLRLSQRRAAAVKQYMVTKHGIPARTLDVVGMGKSAPLLPQNPYAPENRRVQFRAVDLSSTHAREFSPGKG